MDVVLGGECPSWQPWSGGSSYLWRPVPKDRAILWAESDSGPVRSSEPRRCTPQGRTTHSMTMDAQSGRGGPDTPSHTRHTLEVPRYICDPRINTAD